MAVTTRLTAEEFLAYEGERPRVELVDGELVVNDPSLRHQSLAGALYAHLREWTLTGPGRGKASINVNVRLDEGNVYKPDVWWRSEARRPGRDAVFLDGAPDLAVEIRSPSTWRYDLGRKKAGWERNGLPELWLVDHVAETVLVYRRSTPAMTYFDVGLELARGDALGSPRLPGFGLTLAALFDEP